jgi:hypothetical protein
MSQFCFAYAMGRPTRPAGLMCLSVKPRAVICMNEYWVCLLHYPLMQRAPRRSSCRCSRKPPRWSRVRPERNEWRFDRGRLRRCGRRCLS